MTRGLVSESIGRGMDGRFHVAPPRTAMEEETYIAVAAGVRGARVVRGLDRSTGGLGACCAALVGRARLLAIRIKRAVPTSARAVCRRVTRAIADIISRCCCCCCWVRRSRGRFNCAQAMHADRTRAAAPASCCRQRMASRSSSRPPSVGRYVHQTGQDRASGSQRSLSIRPLSSIAGDRDHCAASPTVVVVVVVKYDPDHPHFSV